VKHCLTSFLFPLSHSFFHWVTLVMFWTASPPITLMIMWDCDVTNAYCSEHTCKWANNVQELFKALTLEFTEVWWIRWAATQECIVVLMIVKMQHDVEDASPWAVMFKFAQCFVALKPQPKATICVYYVRNLTCCLSASVHHKSTPSEKRAENSYLHEILQNIFVWCLKHFEVHFN